MLGALERWVLRVGSGRRRGGAEAASPRDDLSHRLFGSTKRDSRWGPAQSRAVGVPAGRWPSGRVLSQSRPSALGDVHVGMADRNGQLEVEVIQARGLIPKMGSKSIPGRWLEREGVGDGGGAMGTGAVPGPSQEPAPSLLLTRFPTQPPT